MQFMKGKSKDDVVSLLGEGVEFAGELTCTNNLRASCVIKGKVRSEATFEIGPGGKVDAEVAVRRIVVSGEFHGTIRASERVEILKEGKVYGEIYSPCLIIEAGAIFEGRCNMSDSKTPVMGAGASLNPADSDPGKLF
jgi:cytoskeletal protein CcmA (bactofilin family)